MLKLKSFLLKHRSFIIISSCCIIMLAPFALLTYSLLGNKRDFILANYQSYINPKVQEELKSKYGVSYDYFESAESAKALINKNIADVVNTTSYELVSWARQGLISKLDWSRFNLPSINNSTDALNLFIKPVQDILTSYDIDKDGNNDNLLDYGIPYFLQDLVFCYRGNKINELSNGVSWEKLFDVISKDNRFKSKKHPQLIAINDSRTIYSIPRTIQNNDVNPQLNASIGELQETYKLLSSNLNEISSNSIIFNSDSGVVLNKLAINEVSGSFCFNGDALYAALGGDEGAENQIGVDIHVVKPSNNLVALDLFVINKNISNKNLDKAYELLKSLCLDMTNEFNSIVYQNFDYVYYTPPLKIVNELAKTKLSQNEMDFLEVSDQNINKRVEQPLTDLIKSNLQIAWITFKSYLD